MEIHDDYKQRFYHSVDALDTLRVETSERFDGAEFTDTDEFVASFDITTIGFRFDNEFFVGGRTGRGWGVIEKWQRNPKPGGPITSSGAGSPAPIGSPMAPTTLQQSFVGGTYVPPADRTGVRELSRDEVIVATPDTPVPDAIGVDPEGRFLLVVAEGGDLHQVDLSLAEPQLELLFTAIEIPPLADVCSLSVAQHTSFGRLWFVFAEECGAAADAVLFDYNNDGVIDDFVVDDGLQIGADYLDSSVLTWF